MTLTWDERAAEVARREAPDDGTTIFVFEGQKFRTVRLDGEPWFVLGDVCRVLGMTNVTEVKRRLNEADFSTTEVRSGGQGRRVGIVNESGLYDVILDSRKPQAKAFRRWITSEVIPSIRKTGSYTARGVSSPAKPELPQDYLSALKELVTVTEKAIASEQVAKAAIKERDQVSAELEQAAPKVDFYDSYVQSDGTYNLTDVAKILGWRRNFFIDELRERNILYKQGGSNLPKQEFLTRGWFKVVVRKYEYSYGGFGGAKQTRVTPVGLEALSRLMGEDHGLKRCEIVERHDEPEQVAEVAPSRFVKATTFGDILDEVNLDWYVAIELLGNAGVARGNYVQPLYRNYFVNDWPQDRVCLSKRIGVTDQGKKFLVDLFGPSVPDFSNVRNIF